MKRVRKRSVRERRVRERYRKGLRVSSRGKLIEMIESVRMGWD